jgi:hypothetical protein
MLNTTAACSYPMSCDVTRWSALKLSYQLNGTLTTGDDDDDDDEKGHDGWSGGPNGKRDAS